jgi:transcriptional regulator with XRE-family HTH domain
MPSGQPWGCRVQGIQSPTIRRRRLALELRRLRESARLTCDEVAEKLECSASKISRVETGQVSVTPRDMRDFLEIYGVPADQRENLVQLARDSRQKGWWDAYKDAIHPHYVNYVGLESAAAEIRTYEVGLIPGLLQTTDYARTLIRVNMAINDPDVDVERLVELVAARQPALTRADPLKFWAVLDEAALRREVGGRGAMREQLVHLLELGRLPNVAIQVIPLRGGAHPAMGRSFLILSFPEGSDPDVVYLSDLSSALYVENLDEVDTYNKSFDHLRAAALSFDDSAALIRSLIDGAPPGEMPAVGRSRVEQAWSAATAPAAVPADGNAVTAPDRVTQRPGPDRFQARTQAARRNAARQRQRTGTYRHPR